MIERLRGILNRDAQDHSDAHAQAGTLLGDTLDRPTCTAPSPAALSAVHGALAAALSRARSGNFK